MIPKFNSIEEKQQWLVKNNSLVINTKKSTSKMADGIGYSLTLVDSKGEAIKADKAEIGPDTKKIKVRSIINTTNLFDSHGDVHLKQLWNKSLKEDKDDYLVKQHAFNYDGIITDNVHAFAKLYQWSELGFHYKGETQALVYDSVIDSEDPNWGAAKDMFFKYVNGKVKQHSVCMRYINLFLCVNNQSYKEYFDNWEKYKDEVVNLEDAEEEGFFYAVSQAKKIEGSAVVKGSNFVTPTQSVEAAKNTSNEIEAKTEETHLVKELNETKFFNFNLL